MLHHNTNSNKDTKTTDWRKQGWTWCHGNTSNPRCKSRLGKRALHVTNTEPVVPVYKHSELLKITIISF